jgi:uncharacterized protein (DUF433 family)
LPEAEYRYIALDHKGNAIIVGTTLKVVELISEKLAYGWSPEEIRFQHPYLSLGQIYSALAYYADHQEEMEKEIGKRLKKLARFRKDLAAPSLTARLRRTKESL